MLRLSQVLIQHHEIDSFQELLQVVRMRAQEGEILFEFDLKPEFRDTPRDWQSKLEMVFTAAPK